MSSIKPIIGLRDSRVEDVLSVVFAMITGALGFGLIGVFLTTVSGFTIDISYIISGCFV